MRGMGMEETGVIKEGRKNQRDFVSVVISAYNEEGNIEKLYEELCHYLSNMKGVKYELIFVNDGSTDNTLILLKRILEADRQVRIVNLLRNHGHEIAMTAGMDQAQGGCVVFMDADLQHPPPIVPELIRDWQAGADLVLTKRIGNHGQGLVHKMTSKIFYRLLNSLSDVPIQEASPDFRLIDRKYIEVLKQMREGRRMFRGMISWLRAPNAKMIEFEAPPRFSGQTKYSLRKLAILAVDSIISFSIKPLRLATYAGIASAFVSLVLGIRAIYHIVVDPNYVHSGYGTTIVLVIFIGSIQLIVLGIIGEYLGRVHLEVKNRPLYFGEYFVNPIEREDG